MTEAQYRVLKLKPTGLGQPNDYEVLDQKRHAIGRIMWTHAAPADCRPPSGMPMLIGMAGRASASRRARTRMRWVTTQKKAALRERGCVQVGGGFRSPQRQNQTT